MFCNSPGDGLRCGGNCSVTDFSLDTIDISLMFCNGPGYGCRGCRKCSCSQLILDRLQRGSLGLESISNCLRIAGGSFDILTGESDHSRLAINGPDRTVRVIQLLNQPVQVQFMKISIGIFDKRHDITSL